MSALRHTETYAAPLRRPPARLAIPHVLSGVVVGVRAALAVDDDPESSLVNQCIPDAAEYQSGVGATAGGSRTSRRRRGELGPC